MLYQICVKNKSFADNTYHLGCDRPSKRRRNVQGKCIDTFASCQPYILLPIADCISGIVTDLV